MTPLNYKRSNTPFKVCLIYFYFLILLIKYQSIFLHLSDHCVISLFV